jgi:hypothetical protein
LSGHFLLVDALLAEQLLSAMASTEDFCAGRFRAIGTYADQSICIAVGLGECHVVVSALCRKATCQDGGCWAEHVAQVAQDRIYRTVVVEHFEPVDYDHDVLQRRPAPRLVAEQSTR